MRFFRPKGSYEICRRTPLRGLLGRVARVVRLTVRYSLSSNLGNSPLRQQRFTLALFSLLLGIQPSATAAIAANLRLTANCNWLPVALLAF